jgi:hypothetical protein
LKIRFAFSACRRATCATDTPGARICRQIERFPSALKAGTCRVVASILAQGCPPRGVDTFVQLGTHDRRQTIPHKSEATRRLPLLMIAACFERQIMV